MPVASGVADGLAESLVERVASEQACLMDHDTRLKLFDGLMGEQRPFLETVLWRLTGRRELFADALQQSLLQIWRHLEHLQGPGRRAYLYRIAQSSASQAWRNQGASQQEDEPDRQDPLEPPDTQASRNELAQLVRRAISGLPEQQSRAITMRYLEQKGYETMARELECSEQTARSQVSKALEKLRNVLRFARLEVREGSTHE